MAALDPPQTPCKKVSDVETQACSFADLLDTGELLTTLTSVLEVTTTDLTLDNKAISTAILSILDEDVEVGEAVQWRVTGGTVANSLYGIKIIVVTDSSPARTLVRTVTLGIEAD